MINDFLIKNMYILFFLLIIIVLIIYIEIKKNSSKNYSINVKDAIELINGKNATVIDVRNKKVFNESHIINAKNIPYENNQNIKKNLLIYKKKIIIIVSNNNDTSIKIINILKNINIKNVKYIHNGMEAWNNDELPTKNKNIYT